MFENNLNLMSVACSFMETEIINYIAMKFHLLTVGLTMAKNHESLELTLKILSENHAYCLCLIIHIIVVIFSYSSGCE